MPRTPPNLPERKDLIKRRGYNDGRRGVLEKMDDETLWATVRWNDGGGPTMMHLYEIERARPAT